MTKQELLNNKYWQQLPPDTEIVLNTAPNADRCRSLNFSDLTYKREISGFVERKLENPKTEEPLFRDYLVINTCREYDIM